MTISINGSLQQYTHVFGEKIYYCKPTCTGTGDGLTWQNACTFRTAVSKLTGTEQIIIMLGAGIHDTNNGSDATGTTISSNYVRIKGFGEVGEHGQASVLANKAASATHILIITGNACSVQNITFDNIGQLDEEVIMLNIQGDYNTVQDCLFRQAVGEDHGTGILIDNGSTSTTLMRNRFRSIGDYGLSCGDCTKIYAEHNVFWSCGVGLYASHANATEGIFTGNKYFSCTTAVNLATAQTGIWYSSDAEYIGNTTNFAALTDYAEDIFIQNTMNYGCIKALYPTGSGITVDKDANAWTYGDYHEIIPKDTITKPFRLTAIHFQSWSSAQIFNVELFFGEDTPGTTSLGVHQVVMGSATATGKVDSPLKLNMYVPANGTVGCKLASSTDGADDVTIVLEYESM